MYVTASNNEPLDHHADQHDRRLHRLDFTELLDPTRKKEAPTPAASPAPAPVAAPEPEGLSAEVVAAITAAVTLCGFSGGAIRTIRPLARDGWKNSGRALR